MEASKARTKREAGNLALRFERPAEKGGRGEVVLSFQDGERVRKYRIGTIGPCTVKTELGPIGAFEFVATKEDGLQVRCKTMAAVKRAVNLQLFEEIVGEKAASLRNQTQQGAGTR